MKNEMTLEEMVETLKLTIIRRDGFVIVTHIEGRRIIGFRCSSEEKLIEELRAWL